MGNRRWTEEEINILTELSSKVYIKELTKKLNRSEYAIYKKAKKLGIMLIQDRIKWTNRALAKLSNLAQTKSITELAEFFKTTNRAIITIASRNGIHLNDDKIYWTEDKIVRLRELAGTLDALKIAEKMNISTSAVYSQAEIQNIKIKPNKRLWTEKDDEELQILVQNGKTLIEICGIMGKKDATVLKKAKELNLDVKKENRQKWTEDEIVKLRELSKTKERSEIVKELNRTSNSISAMAKRCGIKVMCDEKNGLRMKSNFLKNW